jgi:p21-activated kinase 1
MAKSQSGSSRSRQDPGLPPGSAPIGRSQTQKQQQQQAPQQGVPRRRDKAKENEDVVRQLQAICSPGDPHGVYKNLHKIGQG